MNNSSHSFDIVTTDPSISLLSPPASSGVFHLLAAEEPFSSQLKAFVRVFTAKTDDLKRYVSMERDVLGSELMAEQWGPGDLAALQFLIQR